MSSNSDEFDFSQPVDFGVLGGQATVRGHQGQADGATARSSKNNPTHAKNHQIWVLIFVLLTGLIAAGAFSVNQTLRIQELESEFAANPQVVGASTNSSMDNIIVGSGFSIIVDQKTPSNFELKTNFGRIKYLNALGSTTQLLSRREKGGIELLTGIEVQVVEYDNKLTEEAFLKRMQEVLGGNYTLASEKIKVPKQFELRKFVPRSKDDPTYYVTVTADNYYVIKLYNQTAAYPEFTEDTRFTDKLIPALWLN